jgi:hypothetical protein
MKMTVAFAAPLSLAGARLPRSLIPLVVLCNPPQRKYITLCAFIIYTYNIPRINFCCSKDRCVKVMSRGLGEMSFEKYIYTLCVYIYILCIYALWYTIPSRARKFVDKCMYWKENRRGERLRCTFCSPIV